MKREGYLPQHVRLNAFLRFVRDPRRLARDSFYAEFSHMPATIGGLAVDNYPLSLYLRGGDVLEQYLDDFVSNYGVAIEYTPGESDDEGSKEPGVEEESDDDVTDDVIEYDSLESDSDDEAPPGGAAGMVVGTV